MRFINDEGHAYSRELATIRGSFPNFTGSIYDRPGEGPIRNATVTTIAPTGTISIIANASSGVEPLFAVSFVRQVLDKNILLEVNPIFEEIAKERGFYSDELMQRIAEHGTVQDITEVPEDVRRIFVTAHDITPEVHIDMQAAFQKYTDNAVSKTVNFPNNATIEDVEKVYRLAYKLSLQGSNHLPRRLPDEQVLSTGKKDEKEKVIHLEEKRTIKRERPKALKGWTYQMQTGCGPLYITVNEDKAGLFELFTTMGKAGGCASSQCEAIGRWSRWPGGAASRRARWSNSFSHLLPLPFRLWRQQGNLLCRRRGQGDSSPYADIRL